MTSYRLPEPPAGVSLCSYVRTPDGSHRLRVEGNLTTALHGEGKACGSLHADEVSAAADSLLALVGASVEATLPARARWDLHRLDPSRTVSAGESRDGLLEGALRAWEAARTPRQTVARYNRETVRWQRSGWRSWEVYDKSSEMESRGWQPIKGLVRLEARVRPRKGTGAWKDCAPTLAFDAQTRGMVMDEIEALGRSVVARAAAVGMLATIEMLVEGGVPANSAMRLAAYLAVADEMGQDSLTRVGISDQTIRRWKREIAAALGDPATREDRAALIFGRISQEVLAFDLPDVYAKDIAPVKKPGRASR